MSLLDAIRFGPEQELITALFDRYGLEDIIQHHEDSGGVVPIYDAILGSQLRLTPILAPRLCTILDEARERLEFEPEVSLFVEEAAEVNASAIHSLSEETPNVISLTSGLVERMTDDELRFVLGHELGHLHYRHYRARLVYDAVGRDHDGDSKMPLLLQRRMETWERLAELSADRAGHAAVDGHLEPIVSVFFKLASGLGPEHLRFDINAFLEQLEDLRKLKRREILWRFSHPVTPVRVRALQLYGGAGGRNADHAALEGIDADVSEIAKLMDFEVTEPLEVNARDFLVAGGLLAAHSDGAPITQDQRMLLINMLVPLSADPETDVAKITTEEQAREVLAGAATWLKENAGTERFSVYRQLAHMVAVDGHLHPKEQAFMLSVAGQLEIPAKAATQTLFEVLAGYLQTQAAHKAPAFAFRLTSEGRRSSVPPPKRSRNP